jgi:hypothetical protein
MPKHIRFLSKLHGTRIIECCIADFTGPTKIYIGSFDGKELLDTSSLVNDWWGGSENSVDTNAMTLPDLFAKTISDKQVVTCFKLDVEGMEQKILPFFEHIPQSWLPKTIVFEYGGGAQKSQNKGPRNDKNYGELVAALGNFNKLGYRSILRFDSSASPKWQIIDLTNFSHNSADTFFPASCNYGNAILFMDKIPNQEFIEKILIHGNENNDSDLGIVISKFTKLKRAAMNPLIRIQLKLEELKKSSK